MNNIVQIYTDGACSGNPGPGGWGAVLIYKDKIKKIYGSKSMATNNQMELLAAIEAIKSLKCSCKIDLFTDSIYLKDGITKWVLSWQANNWKKKDNSKIKNLELWQFLTDLSKIHEINWHWVKAHNGNKGNEMADQLAVKGRDEAIALLKIG